MAASKARLRNVNSNNKHTLNQPSGYAITVEKLLLGRQAASHREKAMAVH